MSTFIEAGRDYSYEPTIEEFTKDLRLDNARINAAVTALHILKTKLSKLADPVNFSPGQELIGEVAMVNKVKAIEEMEQAVTGSAKTQSKN